MTQNWDLFELAGGAANLSERLGNRVTLPPGEGSSREADRTAERWWRGAGIDRDRLATRLTLAGSSIEQAARLLGEAQWRDGAPLPEWAPFLDAALLTGEHLAGDSPPWMSSIPFGPAFAGFMATAADDLSLDSVDTTSLLPMRAKLVADLANRAGCVLDIEFSLFRRGRLGAFGDKLLSSASQPGSELLDEFTRRLRQGGWRRVLQDYPMLARLLAQHCLAWRDAISALDGDLATDADEIASVFGVTGPVRAVSSTSGDLHNGKSVLRVEFADGTSLIYKPRSVRAEMMLREALAKLSREVGGLDLWAPKVVDAGDHGWVEYVRHADVESAAGADEVFRQAGAQLALLHAIGGKDIHVENIICDGRHFVIIDAEVLLAPLEWGSDDAENQPHELGTVFTTALLPGVRGAGNQMPDLGALETPSHSLERVLRPGWVGVGTDAMRFVDDAREVTRPTDHQVKLADEVFFARGHVDAVLDGFKRAYRSMMQERESWRQFLVGHQDIRIRWVARATDAYARLFSGALKPQTLRSGADFGLRMDALTQIALDDGDGSLWSLAQSEISQLTAGDIPRFELAARDSELLLADGTVKFSMSALDWACRRLELLSDADLERQVRFVEQSVVHVGDLRFDRAAPPSAGDRSDPVEAAIEIGKMLDRTALHYDDTVGWIGVAVQLDRTGWVLESLRHGLYSGRAGIAVFMAGLYAVTGEPRWRDLSRRCLGIDTLQPRMFESIGKSLGFGAHDGGAGYAYALVVCGRLLNDRDLTLAADSVLRGLARLDPATAPALDVTAGVAGTVLATTRLDSAVPDLAIGIANRCAEHLLVADLDPVLSQPGYAHGGVGVAAAAAAVGERSGNGALSELVSRALEFESRHFDPVVPGWQNVSLDPVSVTTGWCWGQDGHLLGRAQIENAGFRLSDSEQSRRAAVLKPLLTTAASTSDVADDTLCCGAAGRLEVLRYLGGADAARTILGESIAGDVMRGLGTTRRLRIRVSDPSMPSPGLFQGDAGIGWSLLALAEPSLPNLLDWQLPPG